VPTRKASSFTSTAVSSVSVGDQGDASLQLADGSALRQPRPVAYQVDDAGVRHFVAVAFRQLSPSRLGFRVTGYDRSRALIIDPVLTYSTRSAAVRTTSSPPSQSAATVVRTRSVTP